MVWKKQKLKKKDITKPYTTLFDRGKTAESSSQALNTKKLLIDERDTKHMRIEINTTMFLDIIQVKREEFTPDSEETVPFGPPPLKKYLVTNGFQVRDPGVWVALTHLMLASP